MFCVAASGNNGALFKPIYGVCGTGIVGMVIVEGLERHMLDGYDGEGRYNKTGGGQIGLGIVSQCILRNVKW